MTLSGQRAEPLEEQWWWGVLSAEAQPRGSVWQSSREKPKAPRGTSVAHPCWALCPPTAPTAPWAAPPARSLACLNHGPRPGRRPSEAAAGTRDREGEAGLMGSESQGGP